jgi:hypothetical protein
MILKVPHNAKTFELTNSIIWFDKDGILYSLPKEAEVKDPTTDEIYAEMDRFRKIIGPGKVCMIADADSPGGKPPKKEQRKLMATEISTVTKALAILATSPLTKMIIKLFYAFAPPDYPVKIFSTEEEAKEWIRQYL